MKSIDYLYTSKNFVDVIKFYNYFNNKNEIIKWMNNRPKIKPNLIEYNSNANNDYAIVVIPTIDSNSKWSQIDKKIFKNFHIIFSENKNKKPNKYFNYAFAVNIGVKAALKYDPKWIIVSNDDIFKIDNLTKLMQDLKRNEKYDTLFFPKSNTYSNNVVIAKPKFINMIRPFSYWRRNYAHIVKKFGLKYEVLDFKRHGFLYKNIFYKKIIRIKHHQSNFLVINSEFIKSMNNKLFDDTFINGHEDTWLSYKYLQESKFKQSSFNIGAYTGSSLGTGVNRAFREIVNEIYFEHLLEI